MGATSPLPNDGAVRIATVNNFVSRAIAPDLAKRITATPGRDEIGVPRRDRHAHARADGRAVADHPGAARGAHVLDRQRPLRGVARDHAQAGARHVGPCRRGDLPGLAPNLAEERLDAHLRGAGTYFVMRPDADLARFGFDDAVQAVIDALTHGSNLPELEAKHRDINPRTLRAVVSTLVACEQCEAFFEAAIAPSILPEELPVATFKKLDGGATPTAAPVATSSPSRSTTA